MMLPGSIEGRERCGLSNSLLREWLDGVPDTGRVAGDARNPVVTLSSVFRPSPYLLPVLFA